MNIFPLIYCPVALYAFRDYHKAFLLYAVMYPSLSTLVPFYTMPGMQNLQVATVMNTFFFAAIAFNSFDNKKQKINPVNSANRFPLKKAFFFCIFSISISSLVFPITPFFSTAMTAYQGILNTFIFSYLFWKELKTLRDIKFFIKGTMIVFCIAIAYGFFERFNGFYNPLLEYETSLAADPEVFAHWGYSDETIRGGRVRSIFANPMGCGTYMVIVFTFFYYLSERYKLVWTSPKLIKITFMSGLFFTTLFTNCRSAILGFGISLLLMVRLKTVLRSFLFLPFFLVLLYDWISPYLYSMQSIANPDGGEVSGSSMALRVIQFLAVFQIWADSPLIGYGAQGVRYWQAARPELLGTESFWLQLVLMQGVIGIVSHIYLYYSLVKCSIGKSKRYIIGSLLGWIAIATTTNPVGFNPSFFISLALVINRLDLLNLKEEKYGK